MYWQQIILELTTGFSEADIENISSWLEEHALAVTLSDRSDEALYQEKPAAMPIWQDLRMEILLAAETDADQFLQTLKIQFPQLNHEKFELKIIEEQDWVRLTQSQFPPQRFAQKLWVFPSWEPVPEELKQVVRIDPGLAFGTGTHPTTSLCLEWLAGQNLVGQRVIDFGCGSGILALTALILGANPVWAIDHDPQALVATRNNADLNPHDLMQQLIIGDATLLPDVPVNLVVANILAKPLIALSSTLLSLIALKGNLLLSGLLVKEVDSILSLYAPHFHHFKETQRDDWACLIFENKKI